MDAYNGEASLAASGQIDLFTGDMKSKDLYSQTFLIILDMTSGHLTQSEEQQSQQKNQQQNQQKDKLVKEGKLALLYKAMLQAENKSPEQK